MNLVPAFLLQGPRNSSLLWSVFRCLIWCHTCLHTQFCLPELFILPAILSEWVRDQSSGSPVSAYRPCSAAGPSRGWSNGRGPASCPLRDHSGTQLTSPAYFPSSQFWVLGSWHLCCSWQWRFLSLEDANTDKCFTNISISGKFCVPQKRTKLRSH
jgi:hypothetical protein